MLSSEVIGIRLNPKKRAKLEGVSTALLPSAQTEFPPPEAEVSCSKYCSRKKNLESQKSRSGQSCSFWVEIDRAERMGWDEHAD
jgi:hypothetical protein